MRLGGDRWRHGGHFHTHVVHQAEAQVRVVGDRGEVIPVADEDVVRGEGGVARRGQLDAVDGPLDGRAAPGDNYIAPAKTDRARTERARLLCVSGLLEGRSHLASREGGHVIRVEVVPRGGVSAGGVDTGVGVLQGGPDVGTEITGRGRGGSDTTLAVNGEPIAVGGRPRTGPLHPVARGANASSEELGRAGAAVGEGPVGVDPHVEVQAVIAAKALADGGHGQRGDDAGAQVRFKLHPARGAARGVGGRSDAAGGVVVVERDARIGGTLADGPVAAGIRIKRVGEHDHLRRIDGQGDGAAGGAAVKVGDNDGVVPGVGSLGIGERVSGIRSAGDHCAVEPPLISDRGRAPGRGAEADGSSCLGGAAEHRLDDQVCRVAGIANGRGFHGRIHIRRAFLGVPETDPLVTAGGGGSGIALDAVDEGGDLSAGHGRVGLGQRNNGFDGVAVGARQPVLPGAPLGIHVRDHLGGGDADCPPIILRHHSVAIDTESDVRKSRVVADIREGRVSQKAGGVGGANRLAILRRHRAVVGQRLIFGLGIDDEAVSAEIQSVKGDSGLARGVAAIGVGPAEDLEAGRVRASDQVGIELGPDAGAIAAFDGDPLHAHALLVINDALDGGHPEMGLGRRHLPDPVAFAQVCGIHAVIKQAHRLWALRWLGDLDRLGADHIRGLRRMIGEVRAGWRRGAAVSAAIVQIGVRSGLRHRLGAEQEA